MVVGGREAIAGSLENKKALIRVEPTECKEESVKDDFVYNGRFIVEKGGEFFVEGQLLFPEDTDGLGKKDGSYRTLFGPCCAHNGTVYANSDQNVRMAFRRLTATRKPEIPGYDALLKGNQDKFFTENGDFLQLLQHTYAEALEGFISIEEGAEDHHGDPHIKRLLRIQAWEELDESGQRFERLWLKRVLYKMKRDEIAKPGKVPRMIGDLGVAASLQGFVLTKYLKMAQDDRPIHINGGTIDFCSTPAIDRLQHVFDNLLNPLGRFYMAYFSDDSCFSFRHLGKVRYYNLDISKCDASHGPRIFEALTKICPAHLRDEMSRLIEQCKLSIEIVSQSDKKNKVRGHFDGPTLFSGSTLTTLINNLANTVIGLCLSRVELEEREYTDDELSAIFTSAIEKCGYIVSGFNGAELCKQPEDIQFLKYSPVRDTKGQYRPLLNLGVLLRASGTCKGDLPGSKKTPIEERARQFQSALLQGMYPRSSFPFLRTMKDTAGALTSVQATVRVARELYYKVQDSSDGDHHFFTDETVLQRYGLTDLEIEELRAFSRAGVYEHSSSTFIDKIIGKDYGLASLSW